jgi:hypothetical protein
MRLSPSLVAVKKIKCTTPRSQFTDNEIEEAAKLILQGEGVINPLVVRRISLQSFEVVDGDFEYYAAARAREIEPRKGEMIGVFIIESENEDILNEQVKVFRQRQKMLSNSLTATSTIMLDGVKIQLKNHETRLEKKVNSFIKKLKTKHKRIAPQVFDNPFIIYTNPLDIFNNFNNIQLIALLATAGFSYAKANEIANNIESERNKKKFVSLNDIVQRVKVKSGDKLVRGISSSKMLDIVESLSQISL